MPLCSSIAAWEEGVRHSPESSSTHHGQDVGWVKASSSNIEVQLAYRNTETVHPAKGNRSLRDKKKNQSGRGFSTDRTSIECMHCKLSLFQLLQTWCEVETRREALHLQALQRLGAVNAMEAVNRVVPQISKPQDAASICDDDGVYPAAGPVVHHCSLQKVWRLNAPSKQHRSVRICLLDLTKS